MLQCPDNPGRDYFCDVPTFERVQNTRCKRSLRAYFETLAKENRQETLEDCAREMRDLGLDAAEFQVGR